MSYTNRLIGYAKKLEAMFVVERDDESHKYCVYINLVGYKEKYATMNIRGFGFTIEDACYHYIMNARGGKLFHYITDVSVDVI